MKGNHNDPNFMLDKAIAAVRDDQPEPQVVQTATANAWQRISQAVGAEATVLPLNRIEGCEDVLRLLPDFEAHRLTPARAMLVADHLRECAACRVHAKLDKTSESVLPWRADSVLRPRRWSFGQYALAASLVIAAVVGIGIGSSGLLAPSGYRASLESANGNLFRVDASGEHRAQPGEQFSEGEVVRTAAGSHAVLHLRDGSRVEMSGRSELYVSVGWRDTTLHLNRGIVIVQAAKRTSGHLYVKTADARVAVTGTIFSVNSGIKGSRVSVIEGTVQVAQAAGDSVLQAGEQVTTSASVGEVPIRDEIAWSQDRDKYFALLAQFSIFTKKLENIKLPDLRYQSNLLRIVPDGTVFYAGIPNYGDALAQANQLFQQQLAQSDVLREWWLQQGPGQAHNGPSFDEVIDTIHTASQYLGNEIVVAGLCGPGKRGGILVASQIAKSGLREFLAAQIQQHGANTNVQLLSAKDLAGVSATSGRDLYVLITPDFVAASPDLAMLRDANHRWSQSNVQSGFALTDFGQRIASEYSSGAGLLIAADLAQMARNHEVEMRADRHEGFLESSGFANARYLVVERKDIGSKASNTAELSFNGGRTGIASWLAAPAPIGALDFITPNAAAVGAIVSKSPALMLDDIVQLASTGNRHGADELAKRQAELNLDLRNDLAASLGGEAALALDGPILPTPSWKLIVEVYDPNRLQYSISKLVEAVNRETARNNRPGLTLDQQQVDGKAFYTVRSADPVVQVEVHYTFSNGYLIAGPSQGLVQEAIHTRSKGDSISHSDKFRALFPVDQHANVSGLIYQNLAPVLGPIANQVSAAQLQALQTIVQNSEPSVIAAYGDENQIELASTSKSLGIDLKALTISSLLGQLKSGTPKAVTP